MPSITLLHAGDGFRLRRGRHDGGLKRLFRRRRGLAGAATGQAEQRHEQGEKDGSDGAVGAPDMAARNAARPQAGRAVSGLWRTTIAADSERGGARRRPGCATIRAAPVAAARPSGAIERKAKALGGARLAARPANGMDFFPRASARVASSPGPLPLSELCRRSAPSPVITRSAAARRGARSSHAETSSPGAGDEPGTGCGHEPEGNAAGRARPRGLHERDGLARRAQSSAARRALAVEPCEVGGFQPFCGP